MSWPRRFALCAFACTLILLFSARQTHAQWFLGSLKDTTNRADYIIITPAEYASTVEPLATFRASHQSLSVLTVLLDSITAQFPHVTPDSSIRDFVTTLRSQWQIPRPEFLLLAGNVNVIPSHKTPSTFPEDLGEDSVTIDQWFINQPISPDTMLFPGMALGRFPAWTADELAVMVEKTITYEQEAAGAWGRRSIVVADSGDYALFEFSAQKFQSSAVVRWPDTTTVHVRPDSPLHRSRAEFRELWNQGSALVTFVGHARGPKFSSASYFTSQDAESLEVGSPLVFCQMASCSQWFARFDSIPIVVALLRVPGRGAVCSIAPSGLSYSNENDFFEQQLSGYMSRRPDDPIGKAWLFAEQQFWPAVGVTTEQRRTLLGDPALVIKSSTIASTGEPGDEVPTGFALCQNYPNPFNPVTTINYTIGEGVSGRGGDGGRNVLVQLIIYDILGRQVAMLVNEPQAPGSYRAQFNATGLSTGVYFYRLTAGGFMQTMRMMLLK